MQLGFVIDHSRCIGCHACTVACKSENEVPLGSFRTWVKYTEQGSFPQVKRSFAVLRCNQCSQAPCVEICPVSALDKRGDGIVDVDPKACIGCKACMHGCPYDALYINTSTGTAEKCHFCAHRTEQGLAPACAVVCPTEAIIPGDFDNPESRVSRLKRDYALSARKPEAGTGPNVFYRDVNPAGLDPGATNLSSGFIWSQNPSGPQVDAQLWEALEHQAEARTVYDVPRKLLWGSKITGYLFAKSIAAGTFAAAFLAFASSAGLSNAFGELAGWPLWLSLLGLVVTGGLLIADLKRPERFWMILVRPNWSSWLARGTYFIVAYSACLGLWLLTSWFAAPGASLTWLAGAFTVVIGLLVAAYTGWLFAQAKGRVLWMKRGYASHLVVQALFAGSALLLVVRSQLGWDALVLARIEHVWFVAALLHLVTTLAEATLAPVGREAEYARASRLISHGPFARRHKLFSLGLGLALPALLLLFVPGAQPLAGLLALVGLWVDEDIFVKAGQALPIS